MRFVHYCLGSDRIKSDFTLTVSPGRAVYYKGHLFSFGRLMLYGSF